LVLIEAVRNAVYFATLAAAAAAGFCFWRAERYPGQNFTEFDTYGGRNRLPHPKILTAKGRVWLSRGYRWLAIAGLLALASLFRWFLFVPTAAPPR
jgi:hypothetical protein